MTPYIDALKESLKQGLLLLEGAVTQPIGLTYDLRAIHGALLPDASEGQVVGEEEDPVRHRGRVRVPADRALESLALVESCVAQLGAHQAIEAGLIERARRVLARVDMRLGTELRQTRARKLQGLYVILDPQVAQHDVLKVAEESLEGGARAIQWRDKFHDKGDQLPTCQRLMELCSGRDATFIVNDHADLAASCGAHGLHVGQHDLPIAQARRLLASTQLIGNSNATVQEAEEAQTQGADYIAVGAMFPTGTKENTRPAGLETLRRVREVVEAPIVAIGGINEGNVEEVIGAGADGVAVISAVTGVQDPKEAARRMVEHIESALARRGTAS